MSKTLTTYILSYERPIYLWATLDSLYRTTKSDMRFVLIDSASRDPLVHKVIDGFSRRHMFDEVVRLEENDSTWFAPFFAERLKDVGDVFFSVESDVTIEPEETCWAQRMLGVMEQNPKLAMLGSKIDKSDFVDIDAMEKRLGRGLTTSEKKQFKESSPERSMEDIGPDEVQSPFNPPGRLLALRTEALQNHITKWEQSSDYQMHLILKENGWETGIYGGVTHRHLSLCNHFDYPEYSMADRDLYMKSK
ncbi:hypothetical protein [Flavimaricola marinus]|uniref:Glycosyl transferase family 2 n=1 Tax=Flavimaricola marinus TaxID=1819565 RepID=A0A238LCC0_9RHOB|nr:hypothetical protein [Flavimaricola marinus]SMY07367.1 hypothetical protein LOM8899_01502 [Flavimaricola marinus]